MTIGTSVVLISVGAILKWAVTAQVNGINLQTAGTVLFVLGTIGLVLSVIYTFYCSRERTTTSTAPADQRDTRY
jgi:Domain of unknown function (DUF6458)